MRSQPMVVVVDDDSMLRTIVAAKLKSRGLQVMSAADGEEGLALIRAQAPDLIVLDAMLPGLEGHELLRELKGDPALERIPVVMLTARKQENDIVAALKAGAADYLVKPFIPEELNMRIQRLLPQKAA